MIKIDKLNPFGKLCVTLGMLPSSYRESLTYEEQLLWMLNYIEKTLIPSINNNAQAVEELQALYLELKSYVNSYFDNLDVQQEINNKLDQMAESGQLTDIISQYLGLAGVLAFNTVNDMKNAQNLANGSICKTLGYTSIVDGKGRFYKVRSITSSDVVDNINIISLVNYPTLIAELVPEQYLIDINNKEDKLTDFVVFGDSWADTNITDSVWPSIASNLLNLNLINYAYNGARMIQGLAEEVNVYINSDNDKSKAKYIVVMGGINDYAIDNATVQNLSNAIKSAINTLINNCPQAKILYVSNARYPFTLAQSQYWNDLHNLLSSECFVTLNIDGTIGKDLWNTENYMHLTQAGQKFLCRNILACLTGGEIHTFRDIRTFSNTNLDFTYRASKVKDMVLINVEFNIKVAATNLSFSLPSEEINLPYGGSFNTQGINGSGFENGVCDINEHDVALIFNTTPNTTKYYINIIRPIN